MDYQLELFRWARPEGGFEWLDGEVLIPDNQGPLSEADRQEKRFLFPKPMAEPLHWRYNPLASNPTLFRQFANLEPTEAAYADFAGQYGELGVGIFSSVSESLVMTAEPFCRWRAAHARLRGVADVLTALQEKDAATLRQWITIVNDGARYERKDEITWHRMQWIVNLRTDSRTYLWKWAQQANSDDLGMLRIAQGWAQEQINDAISEHASTSATARVVFDEDRQRMTLRVVPNTLIGAMWLQCARVLTLNPKFRSCEHCGKWFELSPDRRRKQAIYCSDRCKVAAYRERKKRGAPPALSAAHPQGN